MKKAKSIKSYDSVRPARSRALTRRLLSLAALGGLVVAGAVGHGTARADVVDDYTRINAPAVCATLTAYPSVGGIEGIGAAIMNDGLTPEAAGEVVARSVIGWCPEHADVLQAFIAKWTRAGTVKS